MFGSPRQRVAALTGVTVLIAALHCPCVAAGVTVVTTAVSTHDCCPTSERSKHPTPLHSHDRSQSCLHCGANVGALTESADQVAAARTSVRALAVLPSYEADPLHSVQAVVGTVHFDGSPPEVPRTLLDLRSSLII